jgi:hypothetical protein
MKVYIVRQWCDTSEENAIGAVCATQEIAEWQLRWCQATTRKGWTWSIETWEVIQQ